MINSPGRLKDAKLSVELLCLDNLNRIDNSKEIHVLNVKRKKLKIETLIYRFKKI